jgi:hypothetical protein
VRSGEGLGTFARPGKYFFDPSSERDRNTVNEGQVQKYPTNSLGRSPFLHLIFSQSELHQSRVFLAETEYKAVKFVWRPAQKINYPPMVVAILLITFRIYFFYRLALLRCLVAYNKYKLLPKGSFLKKKKNIIYVVLRACPKSGVV